MFKFFSITVFFPDLKGFTSNFLGEDPELMSTHALPGNDDCCPSINPASGLPMINGDCGVDIGGNSYGFNDSLFD
ncbi:MAG: hypothetical protein WA049_19630 [Ferribacterium limneticum]